MSEDEDVCTMYTFSRDDIDAVNIVNWYSHFKELSPKTVTLPIPPEVLKYLKSDGMVMPQNTHTTAHLNCKSSAGASSQYGTREGGDDDDNTSWLSLSDTENEPSIPTEFLQQLRQQRPRRRHGEDAAARGGGDEEDVWEGRSNDASSSEEEEGPPTKSVEVEKFHEFDSLLDASIKELGGAVLPKVNRKSPKDAMWIGFNRSLKCYNPGDIYLLLKTSDVVSHLLENPYRDCPVNDNRNTSQSATATSPYFLVLKEWKDSWGPEMEFRCFICANELLAICQRDVDTCYSSIVKRKEKLYLNVQNFFLKYIHKQFPVEYYVMDIIIHPNGEIYVVDFDVFGLVTDPLLFSYQELESLYEECENHKRVGANGSSRPSLRFLTESRNFRERKRGGQSALASDVMTYMRHCVGNQ